MSDIKKLTSMKELVLLKESTEKQMNAGKQEILICCGAGCIASGSLALKKSLEDEIEEANLNLEVKETGCMGPCSQGPVIMIQPDGIVYESLSADNASRIIKEHIIDGKVIEDFAFQNRASGKREAQIENVDFFNLQKKIVLRNCGKINPLKIEEYIACNGYKSLAEILGNMSGKAVIDEVKHSGLRGRGGAGFPTWMKWNFTSEAGNGRKYVLCNADEGDPSAFMDRIVL